MRDTINASVGIGIADRPVSRPLLRWHGGKWLAAPWIISHLPPHQVYVEPFGGAASVLMRKPRAKSEVWNDLDGDLFALFDVLRSPYAAGLIRKVSLTPFSRAEFEQAYLPTDDWIERARRLLIRSHQGFGSNGHARKTGWRSKGYRAGKLPQHDWAGLPDVIAEVVERLRGVCIERDDALAVMERYDEPDALHYVDPPYLPETRDAGTDYAHEMTAEEHRDLLAFLRDLSGAVVLSGYPSDLYDNALTGWQRIDRAALADGARKRVECLWLNEAAQDGARQASLFAGVAE